MISLHVGDEVRVFSRTRHNPSPEGGWAGNVIKVGRKYATAAYEWQSSFSDGTTRLTVEFDMETGIERGSNTIHTLYVRTPEHGDHHLSPRGRRRRCRKDLSRRHGCRVQPVPGPP